MQSAARIDAFSESDDVEALTGVDRRRFRRIPLAIHGRFLDTQSEEHSLLTRDISCSGAHVVSPHRPDREQSIVLYLDDLGRIVGKVVRHTAEGFAVSFQGSDRKRDKIVDRLTWLWNKSALGLEDERETPRYTAGGPALITLEDGRTLQCRVQDISLTGAGLLAMTQAPYVGETVSVGNLRARVVRSEGRTFGIRFTGRINS